MVDLGPVETAESHLGGTRPIPAGHLGYQETIVAAQVDSLKAFRGQSCVMIQYS